MEVDFNQHKNLAHDFKVELQAENIRPNLVISNL